MSRSAIYTANTSAVPYISGDTLQLGSIVRRFGCSVDLNGNSILLKDAGYYIAHVSVTASPTAAGTVTVSALFNNTAIPGATASAAGTAGALVAIAFTAIVRKACGCDYGNLSIEITGADGTVANTAVVVEKI